MRLEKRSRAYECVDSYRCEWAYITRIDVFDGNKCHAVALEAHKALIHGVSAGLICPSHVNKRTMQDTNTRAEPISEGLGIRDNHSGQ
jgi:hypothetical protein